MELEMQKAKMLEEGKHFGEIVKVFDKTEPYEYTHVVIKVEEDDQEFTIEYSCPSILSENSKLMNLLRSFGVDFEEGKKIDPINVLMGQKVVFMTINKPSKKDPNKHYSTVVDNSLKPKPAE